MSESLDNSVSLDNEHTWWAFYSEVQVFPWPPRLWKLPYFLGLGNCLLTLSIALQLPTIGQLGQAASTSDTGGCTGFSASTWHITSLKCLLPCDITRNLTPLPWPSSFFFQHSPWTKFDDLISSNQHKVWDWMVVAGLSPWGYKTVAHTWRRD